MERKPHVLGNVHSIQTLGTLDGPGVRFVAFLQGCNLRCGCCHNPDTWNRVGGVQYTAEELVQKAVRYRSYFGEEGGVTLSGGEPLLQSEFAFRFFSICKEEGLNTCLDTSGSILDEGAKKLLSVTDRVLLDIKYPTDEQYRKYVGCPIDTPLEFLSYLDGHSIATTLRQVVIPTLNDGENNTEFISRLIDSYHCIDKIELLPFKKICKVKYDKMGIDFEFDKFDIPSIKETSELEAKLDFMIRSR